MADKYARENSSDTVKYRASPGEMFSGEASDDIPTLLRHLSVFWRNKATSVSAAFLVAANLVKFAAWGPDQPSWSLRFQLTIRLANILCATNAASNGEYLRLIVKTLKTREIPDIPGHNPARELNQWRNFDLRVRVHDGIHYLVDIPVKTLGLPDILKDADSKEDGTRLLPGEWIAHDSVDVNLSSHRVLLFFHGGGYCIMSPKSHRHLVTRLSRALGVRALSIEYRLAPETAFPGQLHDAVIAYDYLVNTLRIPPSHIILGGDSAGGNLSLALMLYLSRNNMPLPGASVLISPFVDMTSSLAAWDKFQNIDYLKRPEILFDYNVSHMFVGGPHNEHLLQDPLVSPILGVDRFPSNWPPILIQCGDLELLRDDCVFLAFKFAQSQIPTTIQVFGECVHDQQMFEFTDMAHDSMRFISEWWSRIRPTLAAPDLLDEKPSGLSVVDKRICNHRRLRGVIRPVRPPGIAVFEKNNAKAKKVVNVPGLGSKSHPLMVKRHEDLLHWWINSGKKSEYLTREFIEPTRIRWWNNQARL